VGETTSQMQDASAYATNFSGFDFTNTWSAPSSGYFPELYGVSHVVSLTSVPTTMIYGDSPPTTGSVTAVGLQGGDTSGALTGLTFNSYIAGTTTPVTVTSPVLGSYTITPAGSTATGPSGSYRVIFENSGVLTIDPRPITASLCSFVVGTCEVEKTYNKNTTAFIPNSDFKLTGVVNGDTVIISSNTATYADQNVVNNTTTSPGDVTATGLILGGISASNYVLTTTGPLTAAIGVIDPATVTVGLTGTIDKTYDGTTTAPALTSANYSLTGVISGDTVTLSNTGGVYAQKDVLYVGSTVQDTILVTYSGLSLGGASASNYVLGSVATPITSVSGSVGEIDPLSVTPTLSGFTKVYDGTTNAVLSAGDYTIPGLIGGDTVTLTATSGSYAQKDVGTGITVNLSGLALGGTDGGDYTLSSTSLTGTGSITARPLTITLTGTVSKVYNGTTTATLTPANYVLSNVVTGDTVALNDPTSGTYDTANVGSAKVVTVTGLALLNNSLGDYTIASYGGTVSGAIGIITAAGLTLTLVGTVEKLYDGTTTATLEPSNYDLTGGPAGLTINYINSGTSSTGTYATATAGKNIYVTVSGVTLVSTDPSVNAADYTLSSVVTGPVGQIDPRTVTASLNGVIDKTYDGTTTATLGSDYTINGTILSESVGLVALSGSYASKNVSYVGSTVQDNIPVTFTGLKLTGAYAADYVLSSSILSGNDGEIDPKAITASLIGLVDKTYDGTTVATLKPTNYDLIGVIAGDNVSVSNTVGSYNNATVGKGKTVTVTNLMLAGTNAGDYKFPVADYTISGPVGEIDPRTITATLVGTIDKTYDGTTTATLGSDYSFTGEIAADVGNVGLTAASGTYDTKNVGTGKLVRFTGLSLTGLDAVDYKLATTTLTGTNGEIDPKSITVSLSGVIDKTYDGTTVATLGSNYAITGEITGDGLGVTANPGVYATKNVGNGLLVTFTGVRLTGANAANYTIGSSTLSGHVGEIDPRTVTVTLVGQVVKYYDAATDADLIPGNYQVTGFIAGDAVALNDPVYGTYATSAVGSNIKVTVTGLALTGTAASDYKLSATTVSANIGTIKAR
jgi:hypothetical protein